MGLAVMPARRGRKDEAFRHAMPERQAGQGVPGMGAVAGCAVGSVTDCVADCAAPSGSVPGAEGLPPLAGGDAQAAAEVQAQGFRGAEAGQLGDVLDAVVRAFQQALGQA